MTNEELEQYADTLKCENCGCELEDSDKKEVYNGWCADCYSNEYRGQIYG